MVNKDFQEHKLTAILTVHLPEVIPSGAELSKLSKRVL